MIDISTKAKINMAATAPRGDRLPNLTKELSGLNNLPVMAFSKRSAEVELLKLNCPSAHNL